MNLAEYIEESRDWSLKTFGPGRRTHGIIQHICSELREIAEAPTDVEEWVDVIILALDGAWRAGYEPDDIVKAIEDKFLKNQLRQWPDWRELTENDPMEHIK